MCRAPAALMPWRSWRQNRVADMPAPLAVVKVGGSLYDVPDLGARLRHWLPAQLPMKRVLLVPGGGAVVDAIRHLDRVQGLGEEISHWLALRALSVNAQFLAALLPSARIVKDVGAWHGSETAILDVHAFALADEMREDRLPHSWTVTSDSLAARVAVVHRAKTLVLLKSTTISADVDWGEAARLGWVDERFAEVLRNASADLEVRSVNWRDLSDESR